MGKFCVTAVDIFLSCMQAELLAFRSRSDPNQNTGKETHYRWQLTVRYNQTCIYPSILFQVVVGAQKGAKHP